MSSRVRAAAKFPISLAPDGDATGATPLHRVSPRLPQTPWELELVVQVGPDAGAHFSMSSCRPAKALVGQGAACDFRLRDRSISRRHATIDGSVWPLLIRDLGSTNGTFVNGVAVVEARLAGNETIRFGDTTVRVACGAAGSPGAAVARQCFGRMLGASDAMLRVFALCDRLVANPDPVLVEGEAGTGKELLARTLHEMGARALGPFVVVDCAHGAWELEDPQRDRGDAFERLIAGAAGGTLFLDALGGLEPSLQRTLARALATSSGAARVVAATRADLRRLVAQGRFRDDLYALVAAERVELPPLRARPGDVTLLARHFWLEGGGDESAFPADAIAGDGAHPWSGNVRELHDRVARLLGTSDLSRTFRGDNDAGARSLERVVGEVLKADVSYSEARRRLLIEFEQRYVEQMLDAHHGNVTRAAAASGLARRNFQLIRARRREEV